MIKQMPQANMQNFMNEHLRNFQDRRLESKYLARFFALELATNNEIRIILNHNFLVLGVAKADFQRLSLKRLLQYHIRNYIVVKSVCVNEIFQSLVYFITCFGGNFRRNSLLGLHSEPIIRRDLEESQEKFGF